MVTSSEEISSRQKSALAVLLISALLVPFTPARGNVSSTNVAFTREPEGYNAQTGSFVMAYQLTGSKHSNFVCVSYDYFIFKVKAGETFQGQAVSSGKLMYYTILQSPTGLQRFENSNCAGGYWPSQGFTGATTMNWVAPADGQYVTIFLTGGFYSGQVSFTMYTT